MALKIQEFLRSYGSDHQKAFGALKSQYGVDAKQSVKCPELYLFKYDQIESPMGSPLVQECRGIILNSLENWDVVAYPFRKFFNYGEGHAAKIDWSTARVQEKIDGSLMTLYHYEGEWLVATSGNPDAAGQVNGYPVTFYELFWRAWEAQKLSLDLCDPDFTYMFELTSPYNKVVVPHTELKITLIGVRVTNPDIDYNRDETLLKEGSFPEDAVGIYFEFPRVQEFPLNSFEAIENSFAHIDGVHQEGYVVVDGNFNRVKVKHPQYVALHHLRDSMGGGVKSMVRILQANEGSEFLNYFPEFTGMYNEVKGKFETWIDGLDEEYDIIFEDCNGHRGKVNRKDFALKATQTRIPSYMFARLDGKVDNVRTFVRDLPIDNVMKSLKLKETANVDLRE